MARLLSALVAAGTALVPMVALAPADAFTARTVSIRSRQLDHDTFRLTAEVDPCGRRTWTHLQFKLYPRKDWRPLRKELTGKDAKSRFTVRRPAYYRVVTLRVGDCGWAASKTLQYTHAGDLRVL